MKVYIECSSHAYMALFAALGHNIVRSELEADLVVFTGGEDVTPSFYGDKKHSYTGNSPERDEREAQLFNRCVERNIPMVGICRG
jgi:gamma-glutamyl-gamma-aminobutyrate hydrolase PuuD